MKKLFLLTAFLLAAVMINAQTINDIVKKYTEANKLDKVSNFKTIKITAKMSMMGMDMPMELWMKNPSKIKQVISMNGQEVVQLFDGVKGYTVNPLGGSTDPVEMTPDQVTSITKSNLFQNYMANYLKDGKLTLLGEEAVNGKPAFKIKADVTSEANATIFIDKSSYQLVKTSSVVSQQGQSMTVDAYPSDYTETSGIILPMKTTTSMSGMEMVLIISKVEVNIPIEDSVFTLK
jgi:hypothetical protein